MKRTIRIERGDMTFTLEFAADGLASQTAQWLDHDAHGFDEVLQHAADYVYVRLDEAQVDVRLKIAEVVDVVPIF